MKIPHLSVSRSQTWKECEQKYKFKYHLNVAELEPEQPYFLYGKVIHKIIEEYTLSRGEKHLDEIVNVVLSGKSDDKELQVEMLASKIPIDYLRRLPQELNHVVALNREIGFDGDCEYEFKFDLDPPHEKYLYGFIDRLITKGDERWIVDYKTTKKSPWRKDSVSIMSDLQLQAYALVVRNVFGIPANKIRATLFYLDGGEFVGGKFRDDTLDKTHEYLLSVFNTIQQSDPDKVFGRVGNHCNFCPYRKICPSYSLV